MDDLFDDPVQCPNCHSEVPIDSGNALKSRLICPECEQVFSVKGPENTEFQAPAKPMPLPAIALSAIGVLIVGLVLVGVIVAMFADDPKPVGANAPADLLPFENPDADSNPKTAKRDDGIRIRVVAVNCVGFREWSSYKQYVGHMARQQYAEANELMSNYSSKQFYAGGHRARHWRDRRAHQ